MVTATTPYGGSFLVEPATPGSVFTPERLGDEHRAIGSTVDEFWTRDVAPALDAILRREPGAARAVLRQAAALGLTAMQVPEAWGGLEADLPSIMVAIEGLARDQSYLGWHLGHCGIGMLPLLFYGTDAQKAKYLPRLIPVDMLAAYALTEPEAGTDALAARTRADLSADGRHYLLTGQKMWITNGGEADLFTVFAKVNGTDFTAFLVERAFGVRSGADEHKMGLAGTSTTALYFDQVPVPVENVLGEVGRGHVIALNVLNIGRLELGPNMLGGAKEVLQASLRHAAERRAFGATLDSFGAVREMLAGMVVRMFATESATWRVVGLIEDETTRRRAAGDARLQAEVAAFEEFAAECSIVKVLASEMLGVVADHGVQIHGGYGYHRDYLVERIYRDARINRIFEGTNEINRLLIPGMLMKRALKGDLPLIPAAMKLQDEIMTPALPSAAEDDTPLAEEARAVTGFKKVVLMLAGTAMQRFGEKVQDEQEVLTYIADVLIDTYAAESAVLRARRSVAEGVQTAALQVDAAATYVHEAAGRVDLAARHCLAAMAEGDTLRTQLAALRRLLRVMPANIVAMRRRLADAMVEKGGYLFY